MLTKIIEIANVVYSELGHGHSECVYHKAMLYSLSDANIPYETEVIVPIYFQKRNVGHFRCDIIVENKIIIELKAVSKTAFLTCDSEVIQLNNYMKNTGINTGILINFPKYGGPLITKITKNMISDKNIAPDKAE